MQGSIWRPERSYNMKIDKRSFEMFEEFKYFLTILINPNSIHQEIKCRFKTVNAGHHYVQIVLSSNLQSKNVKIKIY